MRLSRFLLLFGFLSLALAMSAQQRKNNARTVRNSLVTPTKPTVDVHHLIEVYDWAKASAALQSLVQSTKEASAKDSLQSLLRSVRRAEEMMATTQQIVFIDSVVVDKSKLLSAIKMSEEAGKLLPSAQVFPHRNNEHCGLTQLLSIHSQALPSLLHPMVTTRAYSLCFVLEMGGHQPHP